MASSAPPPHNYCASSRTPPADHCDPPLDAVLGEALGYCRQAITDFHRAPTPARTKRNIHGGREPVTDLDLHLQDLLTAALRDAWPGLPVIAEENRTTLGELPDDCLLLDPLDGTAPLLHGSSSYAIAVCLIRSGLPAQGLIDLPAYRVRATATPTELRTVGDLDTLPAHGPGTLLTSPRHTDLAARLLHHQPVRTATPVPTATVKMTLVALGRATAAAYLPSASGAAAPWDYAAAALAVHASGGTVRDDAGADLARTRPAVVRGWLATAHGTPAPDLDVLLRPAHLHK